MWFFGYNSFSASEEECKLDLIRQGGAYLPHVSKLTEFQLDSLSLQSKWVQMGLRKSSNSRKQN
jgi:hypothetical protein